MSEKPHICLVTTGIYGYFDPQEKQPSGGRQRQQHLLIDELINNGYEITVITDDIPYPEPHSVDNVTFWEGCVSETGIKKFPFRIGRLLQCMRNVDADIFYVRGSPTLTLGAWLYSRGTSSSLVHCVSGDSLVDPDYIANQHSFLRRQLDTAYIKALKSTEAVVTLTKNQKNILSDEYGVNAQVIPVCYDYPDDSDILPPSERSHVLWVGRITKEYKRPMQYVELAKSFPDTDFVMIGTKQNNEPDLYERIVEESSSIDNLHFEGFVPPDEIHRYYRKAISLIQTTATNGIGNTTLEAWRYGTPVISLYSDLDGLVHDHDIGFYCDESPRMMKKHLSRVLEDGNEAARVGQKSRKYLIEHFSIEELVNSYEDVFNNISK